MKISWLSAFIILISFVIAPAQVLKVTASVEYEHLQSDEQKILSDFGSKVEQYFNNYEWIDDEFEYDVECQVQIIFTNVRQTHERLFSAQFIITSNSGEAFLDKNWEFPYDQGTSMNHIKGLFDPLTHLLDYYAYMVLAGEMDTNGPLLGDPLYHQARDIIEQGMRSEYPKGWNVRLEEFLTITDVRTKPLRQVKPDFFEAMYLFQEKKYEDSFKLSKKVLEGIEQVFKASPNNKYLNMFFNSHHRQMAILFQQQNKYLNKLVEFDSKHREIYRKYMSE